MKIRKRNSVGGITSAKSRSLSGSSSSLKTQHFSLKPSKDETKRIAELEQLVGRLSVAVDIQKKALTLLDEMDLKNEE